MRHLAAVGVDGPVSGPDARTAARTELAKHAYHPDHGSNPLSDVLRWLGRRVNDVTGGGGGGNALLIVGVLLLVVAIFVVVRAGAPARRDVATPADVDPLAPVAARDHRRLAAQYTAQGDRRAALREWLRAAIATVEERGILPVSPGRTGAATAREAGPLLPSAAGDLRAATVAFDEVWFGGRAATDDDVLHARAAADAVARARIDDSTTTTATAPPGLAVPW